MKPGRETIMSACGYSEVSFIRSRRYTIRWFPGLVTDVATRIGRNRNVVALIIGASFGAITWVSIVYFSGGAEPWDAEGSGYALWLFLAGGASYLIYPCRPIITAFGVFAGQVFAAISWGQVGPLFLIGLLFVAIYSLSALGGAWLGSLLRPCDARKAEK